MIEILKIFFKEHSVLWLSLLYSSFFGWIVVFMLIGGIIGDKLDEIVDRRKEDGQDIEIL